MPRVLPVEPLSEVIRTRGGIRPLLASAGLADDEYVRLHRAWFRAQERGNITLFAADTLCVVLLGVHPCTVWGDTWFFPDHSAESSVTDDDGSVAGEPSGSLPGAALPSPSQGQTPAPTVTPVPGLPDRAGGAVDDCVPVQLDLFDTGDGWLLLSA